MTLRYVSHPEVVVDPGLAVGRWGLSERGRERATAMLAQPWSATATRIISSGETKALQAAAILAAHAGIDVEPRQDTGELDRTVPGFLPAEEFERVADECFARPDVSARGWEAATAAQARIAGALADLLEAPGEIVVVGHGGVGTLWYCHLAGIPVDRRWDQPGQGHFFTVVVGRPTHHWRRIEDIDGDR